MYYSVSCVLLGQLCITRSVVHYSVSCVLLGHLCITLSVVYFRSVVYYSVSCVFNSVSCVLLGQLCITQFFLASGGFSQSRLDRTPKAYMTDVGEKKPALIIIASIQRKLKAYKIILNGDGRRKHNS